MVEQELKSLAKGSKELTEKHSLEMEIKDKDHKAQLEVLNAKIEMLKGEKQVQASELQGARAECAQYKVFRC
jgi:hypothetical protein